MVAATGIACLVFGSIILIGQSISTIDFSLAQKLGLQERDEVTEPLFRGLELNTARWDLFVLWTLPAAGALMLVDHAWWPYLALVAGGVHVDTAGREMAKILGLRAFGVKTGSTRDARTFLFVMVLMSLIGLWCVGMACAALG
jgi:hypothetical protein